MLEALISLWMFNLLLVYAVLERKRAEREYADFKRRNWPYSKRARAIRKFGRNIQAVGVTIGTAFSPVMAHVVKVYVEFEEAMRMVSEIMRSKSMSRAAPGTEEGHED